MKPDRKQEAQRWLRQAANDLSFMELAIREEYYSQACFYAHQSSEKALKALAYLRGDRFALGHSIGILLESLIGDYPELASLKGTAESLEQYYIPTRYPDALPGGAPFEVYGAGAAREAGDIAGRVIGIARRLIEGA